MAVCATISYLLPLYGQNLAGSSEFFQLQQGLSYPFESKEFVTLGYLYSKGYAAY
jgi:hypothetical protein